jgi:hypothetical protein
MSSTRRNILATLLATPALAMIGSNRIAAQPALSLDLTPDCHDGDDHTVALRWFRLFEQDFRVAKWSVCRG